MATEAVVTAGTAAVDGDDEELVLNSPGPIEYLPMSQSGMRPGGRDKEDLGTGQGRHADPFAKAQVITGNRRHRDVAQGGDGEEIVTGEIDLSVIKDIRSRINVFRDRRPELYHLEGKR